MITPLKQAQLLWNDPKDLIEQWKNDKSKLHYEELISDIIGYAGNMADLGCGTGRFADVLDYKTYMGYDSSSAMALEWLKRPEELNIEFACVDIFNFQINKKFDTIIMIDVAYHQEDPIGSIHRVFELWKYKKLYFTILVGDTAEKLYNSTVVSYLDFEELFRLINVRHIDKIKDTNFSWLLCSTI